MVCKNLGLKSQASLQVTYARKTNLLSISATERKSCNSCWEIVRAGSFHSLPTIRPGQIGLRTRITSRVISINHWHALPLVDRYLGCRVWKCGRTGNVGEARRWLTLQCRGRHRVIKLHAGVCRATAIETLINV